MKNIGGFFELEIARGNSVYHGDALKLTTGRACLNYVLQKIKPSKVYVPFYCCDALFEPMVLNNIDYEFYEINSQLEIKKLPKVEKNEIIICCDFFGVKTNYIKSLIPIYEKQLVIDNSHSFFLKQYSPNNISFTTARKYFGVPDGAFLYMHDNEFCDVSNIKRNENVSIKHNLNRLLGHQEKAFSEFVAYEKTLGSEIEKISILSEKILSTMNYSEVRKARNENFSFLFNELNELNNLIIDKNEADCFCYPLLLDKPIEKEKLYKEKLFIPNLWLDTLSRLQKKDYNFECKLSVELLPLPIDHRYSIKDMQRMCNIIKKLIYG